MNRGFRFALVLASLFAILAFPAGPAAAQGVEPQHSDPTWQASYWNNMYFSGNPVVQRAESSIDYDWGTGSPAAGVVPNEHFSARWTRYIDLTPGLYRFTATSDDGLRVWIDDTIIINQWYDHAAMTTSVDVNMSAGHHMVKVEYYENTGGAIARLSWGTPQATINNWRGEYFNNTTLAGTPSLVRDDAQINFNWGTGSPAAGAIGSDYFSARWTRNLDLPAGNYRFTATIDDGGRVWVNGHLLIDSWRTQAAATYIGDIYVPGGPVAVKMEYYENTGAAVAQLYWGPVGSAPPPPATGGTVVVDDLDPGFAKGGSATAWHVGSNGYADHLWWTRNNDYARANYNWARWYPSLSAAPYEVFVYIPAGYGTTTAAQYWISHSGGLTKRVVNQGANAGNWVSLGTYWFRGTPADYLSLADVTGERYISRLIAFDAAKFVAR